MKSDSDAPSATSKKVSMSRDVTVDDLLQLVPSDTVEVQTPPDVANMGPVAAARAMATYYRQQAARLSALGVTRQARTRAMIIIGVLVSEHASMTIQAALREVIREHASPRDLAAVCEVVPWLAAPAKEL